MFVFYGFKLYNSLRTIRTVNRHLYRGCLNIPLRCFDLGNCILSKRKPCKCHHTFLPAFSRHRIHASAADGKLNAREQFPIVALLRQFERVLFQLICYCFSAIPRSVFTVTYNESVNFIAQRIPIGRSNFLNIIRSGRQICKQRLAVFVGLLNINRLFGGGSVIIKPEHCALQRLAFAAGLGYTDAALCSRIFPCQDNALSIKLEVIRNCPHDIRRPVCLYIYSYISFKLAVAGGRLGFGYGICPLCKPIEYRLAILPGGFLDSSG